MDAETEQGLEILTRLQKQIQLAIDVVKAGPLIEDPSIRLPRLRECHEYPAMAIGDFLIYDRSPYRR